VELIHFDSSKRTAANRTLWQGVKAQLGILRDFWGAIRKHKPDIVHVYAGGNYDTYRKCFDLLVARLLGRKVIFHNHSGNFNEFWESRSFLGRMAIRFAFRRCTRLIVLSDWWKEFHAKIIPADRISVVYNGIKAAAYEQNVHYGRARHILSIPRDRVMVLMMGVMGKRKGAFDIVASAPLVAKSEPSVLFVLVGPDEDVAPGATEQLRKQIAANKLENVVQLRGPADERQRYVYYAAADVFLLPSYAENSPMTIIEAMASKLPVISTKVGAIPEMVEHERTGLLVSPGRCSEITEAVIALVKNQHLRREMGQEGFRKFRHMFDIERVAAPVLWQVYRECMAGEPAKPETRPASPPPDERPTRPAPAPFQTPRDRQRPLRPISTAERAPSTLDEEEPEPAGFIDPDDDAPSAVELIQEPPEEEVRFDGDRFGRGDRGGRSRRGRGRNRGGRRDRFGGGAPDSGHPSEEVTDEEVTDDEVADDEIAEDEIIDDEVIDDAAGDEVTDDEVVGEEEVGEKRVGGVAEDDDIFADETVEDHEPQPRADAPAPASPDATSAAAAPAADSAAPEAPAEAGPPARHEPDTGRSVRPEPEGEPEVKAARPRREFGAGILDTPEAGPAPSADEPEPQEDAESDSDDHLRVEIDDRDADEEVVGDDELRTEAEDAGTEDAAGQRAAEGREVEQGPADASPAPAAGQPPPAKDADQEEADKRAQDALDRLDDE